ncbi:hypothetical protein BU26DRAFT_566745 [Trematosphaeria pertusa]|uniref:Uncharacterized protein n=1 Tax=Trematosphaeria pertusa TaxID=390896 RepID=A0A6A6I8T9_9PLEO|nr:uncharacterized protein BU26DRAFT_566745 [Trematosphaeria pertusa]KAF2246362.1 hypothetical protein BU26DRAFT_566745 [Trematosphaeria pertusa]
MKPAIELELFLNPSSAPAVDVSGILSHPPKLLNYAVANDSEADSLPPTANCISIPNSGAALNLNMEPGESIRGTEPPICYQVAFSNLTLIDSHDAYGVQYALGSEVIQHGEFHGHRPPPLGHAFRPYIGHIPRLVSQAAATIQDVYEVSDMYTKALMFASTAGTNACATSTFVKKQCHKAWDWAKKRVFEPTKCWIHTNVLPYLQKCIGRAWTSAKTSIKSEYTYSKSKDFWKVVGDVVAKIGWVAWNSMCYTVEKPPWVAEQFKVPMQELAHAV